MTKAEAAKVRKAADFRVKMGIIMQTAWMFVKEEGYSMGEAMHVAYLNYNLRSMMYKGHVRFVFRKLNGEVREACGTLLSGVFDNAIMGTGHHTPKRNQLYWDDENNGFRSFRKSRLVSIIGLAA